MPDSAPLGKPWQITGLAVATLAAMAGLYALSRANYLLFHSAADGFSVFVALGVALVAYAARRTLQPGYFQNLATGFVFVAFVLSLHVLAYKGMGVFPGVGSNLATQLWLVSRYVLATVLVLSAVLADRKSGPFVIAAVCAILTASCLLSIFVWQNFPAAFVDGQGLTQFKVVSEYAVIGVLLVSALLLQRLREHLGAGMLRSLTIAIGFFAAADLAFTLYTDVYGVSNMLGHLLQFVAFALILRAVAIAGIAEPTESLFFELSQTNRELDARVAERTVGLEAANRELEHEIAERKRAEESLRVSEERLRAIITHTPDAIFTVGRDLRYTFFSSPALGHVAEDYVGKTDAEIFGAKTAESLMALKRSVLESGEAMRVELPLENAGGETEFYDGTYVPSLDARGNVAALYGYFRNITWSKRGEETIARINRAMKALSGVNQALVRAQKEEDLLDEICDIIVDHASYRYAWVGYAENDTAKSIRPYRATGLEIAAIKKACPTWGEGDHDSPVGRAIRTGRAVHVPDVGEDHEFAVWRDLLGGFGVRSAMDFPLLLSNGSVLGALCIWSDEPRPFDEKEVDLLAEMASDLSYGIEAIRTRNQRAEMEHQLIGANKRLESVVREITETLGKVVEFRDQYTQGHQLRVAEVSRQIGEEMGLPEAELGVLETAALVHDIGKLAVPAEILAKPGRLSDPEYSLIKIHPQVGFDILKNVDFGVPVAEIVLQHHERMDGSGYPNGVSGEEILLAARIIGVADVVEAMASHRPYRAALGLDAAIAEITTAESKYDPDVVGACVRLHEAGRIEL
jgi:putative nucleotidyltransferase with HDIG domain